MSEEERAEYTSNKTVYRQQLRAQLDEVIKDDIKEDNAIQHRRNRVSKAHKLEEGYRILRQFDFDEHGPDLENVETQLYVNKYHNFYIVHFTVTNVYHFIID